MSAAGYVLAAGSIAAANEVIFAPLASGGKATESFNWRIIPATAILAVVLTGFERIAPAYGNALGGMVLLVVLIAPMGKAPSPAENVAKLFGGVSK
jgi:hypothetical protein